MKVVITHHNADLDALASSIAAAKLHGASALANNVVNPPVKKFLALHKDFYGLLPASEVENEQIEEVIVVDVRDARRLKEYEEILASTPKIRVYDHHPASEFDIEADWEQIEPVGACATLLVERLLEENIPISPAEATLFLLGIYSDTGRLSFSSTQARDVKVCAALLDLGANLRVVNRFLRRQYSDEQSKLLVECMASLSEESVHEVEFAFVQASAEKFVHGASSVVQQVLEFGGHDAIFGVIEFRKNRRVQVIGRSRVSYVNMGAILSQFGGGGHRGAAAATIKNKTPEEVVREIKALLCSTPPEPTRVRDLMKSPVVTVSHDTPLGEVAGVLQTHNISGAPVIRDEEICGIVSKRDVRRAERSQNLGLPVSSHMTHEVSTISPREPIEDALSLMIEHDVGRLPVVSDGKIVGIITRTDLIAALYMKLPEDLEPLDEL